MNTKIAQLLADVEWPATVDTAGVCEIVEGLEDRSPQRKRSGAGPSATRSSAGNEYTKSLTSSRTAGSAMSRRQ